MTALLNFSIGFERSAHEVYQGRDVDLIVVRAGVTERMTSSLKEELAKRIERLPAVAAVNPSLTDLVSLGEGSLVGVSIHGWPSDSFVLKRLALVAGKPLASGKQAEVLLGQGLAESLHKHVGDEVEIESCKFRVAGVFQGANVFEDCTAVVLLADLQRLMERPGQVTEFQLLIDPKIPEKAAAVEKLSKSIEELRDEQGESLGLAAIPTQQFVSTSTEVRLAHALAWSSSAMALLIGGIGMFNTMTMTVLERTQEIGILRAIGWRKQRVWLVIFCESELLCFAGALLGIASGVVLTQLLSQTAIVRGLIRTEVSLAVLGLGVILALAVGLIGGIYPALRGARLEPVEAMRHE